MPISPSALEILRRYRTCELTTADPDLRDADKHSILAHA